VLGLLSFGAALGALLLTQDLPPGEAAFEALSALGTVGLSLGATARLDEVGKLVVVAAMFVGRVGPLSVLLLLTARARSGAPWRPTRNLPVG
jgi:trk system potassium uptake protein TrkH